MRADARVFVHVDRLACGKAKDYLNGWLRDEAKKAIGEAAEEAGWRRHVSAWWLLNLGDAFRAPTR